VEPPSAIVSGRGDSEVACPPLWSSVAEDPEFQSLKALVMTVAEWVKKLVDRDRSVSGPAPVADAGVEVVATRNFSPASRRSSLQERSVTNFIDESVKESSEVGNVGHLGSDEPKWSQQMIYAKG